MDSLFNTFIDQTTEQTTKPKEKQHKTKSKQKFTAEEDAIIREQIELNGVGRWPAIASHVPGRTARQCRERWVNYLSPNVSHAPWTEEEDKLLKQLIDTMGSKWSQISKHFPNRTDVSLKNHWSYLKRRISSKKEKPTLPAASLPVFPTETPTPTPQVDQQPIVDPMFDRVFEDNENIASCFSDWDIPW